MALVVPNFVYEKQLTFNPERDFTISTLTDYIFNGTGKKNCWIEMRVCSGVNIKGERPHSNYCFGFNGFMATPIGGTHHGFISTSKVRQTGADFPDILCSSTFPLW